jgi:hypothetical protein
MPKGSLLTLVIVALIAYVIGVKFPGPGTTALAKVGL